MYSICSIMAFCLFATTYIISFYWVIVSGQREMRIMQNFNVLLNLYKMNPLQKSNVYKDFYTQAVLTKLSNKLQTPLNLESNDENLKERTNKNLNLIEKIIHTPTKNVSKDEYMQSPDFDVNNIDTEKFTVDLNIKEFNIKQKHADISSAFEHMTSNETMDAAVTKLNEMLTSDHNIENNEKITKLLTITTELYSKTTLDDFDSLIIKKSEKIVYENKVTPNFPSAYVPNDEGVIAIR